MEFLTLAFMQRALLAGIAIGLILPFLGVFVSMRRMAFFGDGIAHASLAGIALGIVTGANPFWGALAVGIAFGTALANPKPGIANTPIPVNNPVIAPAPTPTSNGAFFTES